VSANYKLSVVFRISWPTTDLSGGQGANGTIINSSAPESDQILTFVNMVMKIHVPKMREIFW